MNFELHWRASLMGLVALVGASSLRAQNRTSDNAVTQAEDVFGYSVGRESLGIYSSDQARGFSPTAAGNVRIDGLYIFPVVELSPLLIQSESIKVGLSAQGYPFAAPSGIVDQVLRKPTNQLSGSIIANGDSRGSIGLEVDASIPVSSSLAIQAEANGAKNHFADGTSNRYHREAIVGDWCPAPGVEIVPFWSTFHDYDNESSPYYLPAGDFLPPQPRSGHFIGPPWVDLSSASSNHGVLANAALSSSWTLRAGIFRSVQDWHSAFTYLLNDIQPDGSAERVIESDPPTRNIGLSGEVRLTHTVTEGPRLHTIHLSVRGRDTRREFGGSDVIDLGQGFIDEDVDIPRPTFDFGPLSHDQVKQMTYGVAYDMRWKALGELGFGVSRTNYRKATVTPDNSLTSRSSPWIYNATASMFPLRGVAVYAGYARGLEEGGTPPPNAANRRQALPPIMTRQVDGGVRVDITSDLKAVAGVFDLERPYFGFNLDNEYVPIGTIRSKGLEFSLSGSLTKRLNVVAGGVILDASVATETGAAESVGSKPVGIPSHILSLDANWQTPIEALSLDAALSHRGSTPGTTDNEVLVPARAQLDVGGRYRFVLAGVKATARVQVANIFNNKGFSVAGPGSYYPNGSRSASMYLTMDL